MCVLSRVSDECIVWKDLDDTCTSPQVMVYVVSFYRINNRPVSCYFCREIQCHLAVPRHVILREKERKRKITNTIGAKKLPSTNEIDGRASAADDYVTRPSSSSSFLQLFGVMEHANIVTNFRGMKKKGEKLTRRGTTIEIANARAHTEKRVL